MANPNLIEDSYDDISLDRIVGYTKERSSKFPGQILIYGKLIQAVADTPSLRTGLRDDTRTYLIRYRDGIDVRQIIVDEGIGWDIIGVKPVGRRAFLELAVSFLADA